MIEHTRFKLITLLLTIHRFRWCFLVACFLTLSAPAALHGARTIATGPEGGAYHAVGMALAELLGAEDYVVLATEGSVENLALLGAGAGEDRRADLAIVQSDLLRRSTSAAAGQDARVLAALYPEYVQVLVAENSTIRSLFQLVDRPVFLGSKRSGSRVNALDLLEFADLLKPAAGEGTLYRFTEITTLADLFAHTTATPEALAGVLDALGWSPADGWSEETAISFPLALELVRQGWLAAAFTTQGAIVRQPGLHHLHLREELLPEFRERFEFYSIHRLELGGGQLRPVPFVRAQLVANGPDVPGGSSRQEAAAITRLFYENRFAVEGRVIGQLDAPIDFFVQDGLVRRITDRIHPGARDFYRSVNLVPRISLFEVVVVLPLLFIALTLAGNAARNTRLIAAFTASDTIAKAYSPGTYFQRAWDRYRTWTCGSWLVIAVWIFLIFFILVVYLIRFLEKRHSILLDMEDPFAGTSFAEAAFWMLTFSATGFNQDIYPHTMLAKILAVIVPLSGLVLTLFILVTHTFKSDRDQEKRARGILPPGKLKDHILVCGWSERVPRLLRDLVSRSSPLGEGAKVLVIAETDAEKPLENLGLDRNRVCFLRGRSSDYALLKAASAEHARGAIVVADEKKLRQHNSRGVLTAIALRRCMAAGGRSAAPIVAELFFDRNREHFERAGVSKLVSLETITARLTAHALLNPGVSGLLLSLLRFAAPQSARLRPARDPLRSGRNEPSVVGMTFAEAVPALRREDAQLLAIVRADRLRQGEAMEFEFRADSPYIFCPQGDDAAYRIAADDQLILVTRNRGNSSADIRFLRPGGIPAQPTCGGETVLLIGNGWATGRIAQAIEPDVSAVIQLIGPAQPDEADADAPVDVERTGKLTVLRTRQTLDADFYRRHREHLSGVTRVLILGPRKTPGDNRTAVFEDDATLMQAFALQEAAPAVFADGRIPHLAAEMRCLDNLRLFHDAGIDQPVPTTLFLEQCLVRMVFHGGLVSEFFLKAMSPLQENHKGRLQRLDTATLTQITGAPVVGQTFDELLERCLPNGVQILALQKNPTGKNTDTSAFPIHVNPRHSATLDPDDNVFGFIRPAGTNAAEG